MSVFKMVVAYRGDCFCGWQRQKNPARPSVQATLENALADIIQETAPITGSGRTDAGVHSLGQVASFRSGTRIPPGNIMMGLNSSLPDGVRVRSLEPAPEKFHPRYDAREKTYRYLVQHGGVSNPLLDPYSHFFPGRLDLGKMRRAAAYLVGRHDFSAFQSSGRKAADPVRTVSQLEVAEADGSLFRAGNLLAITIRGEGYLYRMVRNIAGTLIEVGRLKLLPEDVRAIIESRDRRRAGPTAPARGLTLIEVVY